MNTDEFWQQCLKTLEADISEETVNNWILPLQPIRKSDKLRLLAPNRYVYNYVKRNLANDIRKTAALIEPEIQLIEFEVGTYEPEDDQPVIGGNNVNNSRQAQATPGHRQSLNPNFTFKTHVEGKSNQLSRAAAMQVGNNPNSGFNPLFIYGGVGLGKTHLMQAAGHLILDNNPSARVIYIRAEVFVTDMVTAIKNGKTDEFKKHYRSLDALLIDDIQFFAGKKGTQEEFFHTFNALYESHKQIIVTSDKFPKDIPGLEERLRSRFEWGLIADIQPPDVETKLAILKMKAEQNSIGLPEEVALFLANSVCSNVRELEGYLIRIGAFASLTSTPVSLDMARDVLKDILVERNKELTVEEILKRVSSHYNIKISDIKSPKRLKAVVLPRQIAMYLSRQLTSSSYPEIGERFGGKDHSTIIHAIRKIEKLIEEDFQLRSTIENLKKELTS